MSCRRAIAVSAGLGVRGRDSEMWEMDDTAYHRCDNCLNSDACNDECKTCKGSKSIDQRDRDGCLARCYFYENDKGEMYCDEWEPRGGDSMTDKERYDLRNHFVVDKIERIINEKIAGYHVYTEEIRYFLKWLIGYADGKVDSVIETKKTRRHRMSVLVSDYVKHTQSKDPIVILEEHTRMSKQLEFIVSQLTDLAADVDDPVSRVCDIEEWAEKMLLKLEAIE